ncbi:DUF4114 domain-containing protein [Corallococcus llansteffanensis]|uniref:DUF4114 domain-containing protein n=1 Tax=Corallococcus llansteffanensis TaxID=2316731 RepID=A0A3A8Q8R4_9BACT|nr:DUF4114 domain-containing protein [Corallococcus llansteffanensis]RKH65006.1 DUF4114 domain-containing protein [Corallococcus llansteffanensis]
MRTLSHALAMLMVTAPLLAVAQTPAPDQLCQDDLSKDKQPPFKIGPNDLSIDNNTIELRPDGRLQLFTNLKKLDTENITFPFDQRVTISYVYESAGASHALGYMYMDDVKKEGYADANGNLVDVNGNGILDLHEAIYNLTPPDDTSPLKNKYIGKARRCTSKTFMSGGFKYSHPELAMDKDCNEKFESQLDTTDARPGRTSSTKNIKADWVGLQMKLGKNDDGDPDYDDPKDLDKDDASDDGVFPHIPNLLEPKSSANGNMGLGRMVFLLADDDSDKDVFRKLGPVQDASEDNDGVPDYDVSKYDYSGLERPVNPDDGVSVFDRTVDLGMIAGSKEIIFFTVVFYDARHNVDNDTVAPCLKRKPYNKLVDSPVEDGKCLLHLRTSVSVFFSKSAWNLDQNFLGPADNTVAERNIGCDYSDKCSAPDFKNACTIVNTSKKACGWLDDATLLRLNTNAYGKLAMPKEGVTVMRPGTETTPVNTALDRMNYMPHVIVGAPTTDPFRWILGFEDLNGGGDRDFNDVVFVINKENGGGAKSSTVSADTMTKSLGPDFTITKVRFRRQDDIAPYAKPGPPPSQIRTGCTSAPCWTEEPVGSNACTANGVKPTITYSIAVDCRVIDSGTGEYVPNLTPNWVAVPFPDTSPPTQEVELDLLALGLTGSQLCWKVDISSPNERCRPIIDDVDIGFQAVRSGSYARSSPSTLGNVAVWGVNETPGQAWGTGWSSAERSLPGPGIRAYDGTKDFGIRGRLYLQSLYNPELTTKTDPKLRWEAGRVMALSLAINDPRARKLYSMDDSLNRQEITELAKSKSSPLFPDSLCNDFSEIDNRFNYDLNHDERCATPTVDKTKFPDKFDDTDTNDRDFLVDWLYGYENRHPAAGNNARRPWPMGGINLSTVAVAVPPYQDNWYQNAKPAERDLYRNNFMKPLETRSTRAYVGTMSGVLHAFDTGDFRNALKDGCIAGDQQRGYFVPESCGDAASPAPRKYGSGNEVFSYMPRLMLGQYRNQYVRFRGSGSLVRPQMEASASIANVDLGDTDDWKDTTKYTWTPATTAQKQRGAKTVLVSATGKTNPVVFSLDITDPTKSWYPLPLWEFSLADSVVNTAFSAAQVITPTLLLPDNTGSRHAPSVARLAWGSDDKDKRWAAVVGTDYKPADKRAGAVFLLDMKTGRPLDYGTGVAGLLAGVITFEKGSGIAAETALLDLDQDGTYDVMYVPTTSGSVWRVNLKKVDTTQKLGSKIQKCMVARASTALAGRADAYQTGLEYQQLYSNLAVKLVSTDAGPAVRFYFGTGDNPDEYTDGPTEANPNDPKYQYHLLAFEDADPSGSKACPPAGLDPVWVQKMDAGQKLWGGVTLSAKNVFAATAVGEAADICNLSETKSGMSYSTDQAAGLTLKKTNLQGHAISPPVVHDEHLFVLTATGKMQVMGDENWNNKAGTSGVPRSQIMLWEPLPDGRLPQ